jgi:uncharacterized protein (UPF0128 family)
MSDFIDHANETIHEAHHHGGHQNRNIAIMTAILAAMLAIADMGEKGSENAYLTCHISLSDVYNYYQAKGTRVAVAESEIDILQALPSNIALQTKIKALDNTAQLLRDNPKANNGMKQLLEQAKNLTIQRQHSFHRYHEFETVVGAIQIAIVLASVSIVTKMLPLSYLSGVLGIGAALYGSLIWIGVF